MSKQYDYVAVVGRVLIGVLFLMSGLSKLAAPAAVQGYIASVGLPAPVIAFAVAVAVEVLGSLLLIAGVRTRFVAAGMTVFGYCAVTSEQQLRDAGASRTFSHMRELPALLAP